MDFILVTLVVLLSTVSCTPFLRLDVCSESDAIFTCVVMLESTLKWDVDFLTGGDIERIAFSRGETQQRYSPRSNRGVVYTFRLISSSPLTSTMTTNTPTDLSGATVSCSDGYDSSAGVAKLALHEPPRPLNITLRTAALRSNIESDILSYLYWSVADDHDTVTVPDLNTSYHISLEIFPELNQSNFTTSNTSIWLTLSYDDQDYSISVVAKNCVGTSEPAELYFAWDDQCPIPWENISSNVAFEYSVYGSRLYLTEKREIISVCKSNGTWYPNPTEIVCTQSNTEDEVHYDGTDAIVSTIGGNGQGNHGFLVTPTIVVVSVTVTVVFLFLVVLSLTTAMYVTCRRKQYSMARAEAQTAEQAQNEYTEVEHTHQYQDEDLDPDYSSPHLELGHNQSDHHSTFTLISELQNPLYQNVTNNHNPDESLNLDSLLIQLRAQVMSKWHQFGTVIGVPEDLLEQYSSYPADERLIEILNYWLNNHQNPTWRDVAKVLRDIELNQLAEGIMNVYETGHFPVEVDVDDSDSDDNILLPLPIPSSVSMH